MGTICYNGLDQFSFLFGVSELNNFTCQLMRHEANIERRLETRSSCKMEQSYWRCIGTKNPSWHFLGAECRDPSTEVRCYHACTPSHKDTERNKLTDETFISLTADRAAVICPFSWKNHLITMYVVNPLSIVNQLWIHLHQAGWALPKTPSLNERSLNLSVIVFPPHHSHSNHLPEPCTCRLPHWLRDPRWPRPFLVRGGVLFCLRGRRGRMSVGEGGLVFFFFTNYQPRIEVGWWNNGGRRIRGGVEGMGLPLFQHHEWYCGHSQWRNRLLQIRLVAFCVWFWGCLTWKVDVWLVKWRIFDDVDWSLWVEATKQVLVWRSSSEIDVTLRHIYHIGEFGLVEHKGISSGPSLNDRTS